MIRRLVFWLTMAVVCFCPAVIFAMGDLGGALDPPANPAPARATDAPYPAVDVTGPSPSQAKSLAAQARDAVAAGDPIRAARLYQYVALAAPEAAAGAYDEAARLYAGAGALPEAIAALNVLRDRFPEATASLNVLSRLAKLNDQVGDPAGAIELHLAAATIAADPSLRAYHRIAAAEWLAKAGDTAQAVQILQDLLSDGAPNRHTMRALLAYHRLALPDDVAAQANHAAAFGEKMYAAGAYEQAGPALDLAISLRAKAGSPTSPAGDLWRHTGFSFYRTHHNDKALAYYEAALAGGASFSAETFYEMAKLYTRLGDAEGARRTYRRLTADPRGAFYRTAVYQSALLAYEDGDAATAFRYFQPRCKSSRGANELACWLAAWTAKQSGNPKTALADLLSIRVRRPSEPDRYRYWRGRWQFELGQKKAGLAELARLNRDKPAEYYGVLAGMFLRDQGVTARGVENHLTRSTPSGYAVSRPPAGWWTEYAEISDQLDRVAALVDLQIWNAAGAALDGLEVPRKLPPTHELALAKICWHARRYDLARQLVFRGGVYRYLTASREPMNETFYPLYLPMGYRETVEANAARFNVPPALVYAVILNESSFRPHVVSPAYAVGLMQIMPQTGAEIAAALGEPYDEDSLYDPETNIRFGTWYLRHLLDELGDEPAYAVAAYNAGPKAVGKWLRSKGRPPRELFVEDVPYQETNRYVRRVLTSMMLYETLLRYDTAMR